jgi:hypothetical protein
MQLFVDEGHEGLQGLLVSRFPFHKEFTDSLRRQLRHGSATGSSWPNDNLAVSLSQFSSENDAILDFLRTL